MENKNGAVFFTANILQTEFPQKSMTTQIQQNLKTEILSSEKLSLLKLIDLTKVFFLMPLCTLYQESKREE